MSALPETYRAARIPKHGDPEVLALESLPLQPPGPFEAIIQVKTAALNHLDLWVRRGVPGVKYPLPLTPASDAAGTVVAVGQGADESWIGKDVVTQPGVSCGRCTACLDGRQNLCRWYGILGETRDGGAAEYLTVPIQNLIPKPERLSWTEAPAGLLAFLTAWQMVMRKAQVTFRDRVVVHAVGSGIGHAAAQIAKAQGAFVIGTSRSLAKLDRASATPWFDAVLQTGDANPQWWKEIRSLTGKAGADVVVEHTGAATWDGSINCLARGGRLVTCGATSGYDVTTDLRKVFFKNVSILGSTMGSFADMLDVIALEEKGVLQPLVDRVFPLDHIADAHRHLEAGEAFGKVVLAVDPTIESI